MTAYQRARFLQAKEADRSGGSCEPGGANGAYRGRDEIDRIAGVIKATHPDFQYQPLCGATPRRPAPFRPLLGAPGKIVMSLP